MSWACDIFTLSFDTTGVMALYGQESQQFSTEKHATAVTIFTAFISKYQEIGCPSVYARKSMVILKNKKIFARVIYFGKNFIHVVFQFRECFDDNYCIRKIAKVSGTEDYNHHLRLMLPDDINKEVIHYMKKAYRLGEDL